jgi:hypothetical protein
MIAFGDLEIDADHYVPQNLVRVLQAEQQGFQMSLRGDFRVDGRSKVWLSTM